MDIWQHTDSVQALIKIKAFYKGFFRANKVFFRMNFEQYEEINTVKILTGIKPTDHAANASQAESGQKLQIFTFI